MKYRVEIMDQEGNKTELGEDEIIEVKYEIGSTEKKDYANSRSTLEIEIIGKLLSNLADSENRDNLYVKNKENIINLAKWAESYMEKADYRNVEVDIDLGAERKINYKFMNMFVYDFSQEFSIEKGIGTFNIKLRQKFCQKNKLDIS